MKKIVIINGPNLNLLGRREPQVYGSVRFEDYLSGLRADYPDVELDYFQSNAEGLLIDRLHADGFGTQGIVLNAGGYSHTSVALRDAVAAIEAPVVEVHISNIFAREEYRHHSLLSDACVGVVCGLGMEGYRYAVDYLLRRG